MQRLNTFTWGMMTIKSGDEVIYEYKRKLQRAVQWQILLNQPIAIFCGAFLYLLTRRLKKKADTDVMYAFFPALYCNIGIFGHSSAAMFECGYPAHPQIALMRAEVLSNICFIYPRILKNEIEYLHMKIHKFKEDEVADKETRYTR